jgi:hypothetical protein
MKIYALLNWYDERPDWLAATVASASKLCDGIIAVDGAYFLYPDSLRHPTSGASQATAIMETALSLGMSCTIHVPQEAWAGNEVGKLQHLFDLGVPEPMEDWFFRIDGDELLTEVPYDARKRIEETDLHAVDMRMWARTDGVTRHEMWPIRRLWRVMPEMKVGPAHHIMHGLLLDRRIVLADSKDRARQTPGLDMPDLLMEHRSRQRNPERLERKERYYKQRDALGVEEEDAWPISQQPTSGNGQSSHTAPISS